MIRWFHKKTQEKRGLKMVVEEVGMGEKSDSSCEFVDVFDVDFSVPSTRDYKKPKGESSSKF